MTTQSEIRHSTLVQKSPIFYGWVVWFVATIGLSATSPGQSFSVSLFIDHYIADFGIGRTTISALYGLGTFIASLSLTWVGRRVDRNGNRFMSIAITGLLGVLLLACSLVAGPVTMLLSFVAIRALGQGSLGLVSTTAIAQWFKKRRGRMMGFTIVVFAVFQRFYVPFMQDFIESEGWRAAWVLAGAGMLLGVLPLMALLMRDRPEDFGLEPDGETKAFLAGEAIPFEDNWELGEAMRAPIFWVFTAGRMLVGAVATALIFHQISIFDGLGHSADVAATTYGQAALMVAAFTLLSGWLVDHLPPGPLMALQMLGLMGATGMALVMETQFLLLLYTAAFGLVMGLGSVFDGTVWVNMFGRLHQGAIRGFAITAIVMGTAVGPVMFGLSYDHLGGYEAAMCLSIALAGVVMILSLLIPPPTPRNPPAAIALADSAG